VQQEGRVDDPSSSADQTRGGHVTTRKKEKNVTVGKNKNKNNKQQTTNSIKKQSCRRELQKNNKATERENIPLLGTERTTLGGLGEPTGLVVLASNLELLVAVPALPVFLLLIGKRHCVCTSIIYLKISDT